MDKLLKTVSQMKTEEALTEIAQILKRLLSDMDSDAREQYLMNLIEQSKGDGARLFCCPSWKKKA